MVIDDLDVDLGPFSDVRDGHLVGSIGALLGVIGWTILAVVFYRFSRQPVEPPPVGDRNGQPY